MRIVVSPTGVQVEGVPPGSNCSGSVFRSMQPGSGPRLNLPPVELPARTAGDGSAGWSVASSQLSGYLVTWSIRCQWFDRQTGAVVWSDSRSASGVG
jgi:hypothetical protein